MGIISKEQKLGSATITTRLFSSLHFKGEILHHQFWPGFSSGTLKQLSSFTKDLYEEMADVTGLAPDKNIVVKYVPYSTGVSYSVSLNKVSVNGSSNVIENNDSAQLKKLHPEGIPDLYMSLICTLPISEQMKKLRALEPHEESHRRFDFGALTQAVLNHPDFDIYKHHVEYIADSYSGIFAKQEIVDDFKAINERQKARESMKAFWHPVDRLMYDASMKADAKNHPSFDNRVYALEHNVYADAVLENIDKCKDLQKKGQRFNSWTDFVDNKDRYLDLQAQASSWLKN